MTPKMKALIAGEGGSDAAPTEGGESVEAVGIPGGAVSSSVVESGTSFSLMDRVSFRRIDIRDGFILHMSSAADGEQVSDKQREILKVVTLSIEPETLLGPFDVRGRVVASDQGVDFDGRFGAFESGAESISARLDVNSDLGSLSYAGIWGVSAPFESQGEVNLTLGDVSRVLSFGVPEALEGAKASGMALFSTDGAVLQKGAVTLGEERLSLDVLYRFDPYKLKIDVAGDSFTLDPFMVSSAGSSSSARSGKSGGQDVVKSSGAKGGKNASDFDRLYGFLPQELPLPKNADMSVGLEFGVVSYNGQSFGPVSSEIVYKTNVLNGSAALKGLPGASSLEVDGRLSYAPRAQLSFNIKGKSGEPKNLNALLGDGGASFTGFEPGPYVLDMFGSLGPDALVLERYAFKTGGNSYQGHARLDQKNVKADLQAFGGRFGFENTLGGSGAVGAHLIDGARIRVSYDNLTRAFGKSETDGVLAQPFKMSSKLRTDKDVYSLQDIDGALGKAAFDGALSVHLVSVKPLIKGDINFSEFILGQDSGASKSGLNSISPAAGGSELKVAAPKINISKKISDRWSNAPIDASALDFVDAELDLSFDRLRADKLQIEALKPKIILKNGILDVQFAGGRKPLVGRWMQI